MEFDRTKKRLVSLSLLGAGSFATSANELSQATQILIQLNNQNSRPAVMSILAAQGLSRAKIDNLVAEVSRVDCASALGGTPSEIIQLDRLSQVLLQYVQPGKMDAIYTEVKALAESSPDPKDEKSFGLKVTPVQLRIAEDGFFFPSVVGLDRTSVYETFKLAARNDSTLEHPVLRQGTRLNLLKAKFKRAGDVGILSLKLSVTFPGGQSETLDVTPITVRTGIETPEEMTAIALMTVAASSHLLSDPDKLRVERNAVMNVANKLLVSRTIDARYGVADRYSVQSVVDVLSTTSTARIKGQQLAGMIVAKKQLADYMNGELMKTKTADADLISVPRTNFFKPASNQDPKTMTIRVPRAASAYGGSSSGSRTYQNSYYGYDPLMAYYSPWAYYPNSGFGNIYAPYYLGGMAQGQPNAQNWTNDDYGRFGNPTHHSRVQDPLVYQNTDGHVVILDRSDSTQSPHLKSDGFSAVAPEQWKSDYSKSASSGEDLSNAPASAPVSDAGRATSSVRVSDDAIVTTTTTGWFSTTPSTTGSTHTAPATTTTTGVDYTTTTTTTGVDYTTTTTTGDSTTTTTTGSYDSTGSFDSTTTTTGGDF